MALSRPTLGDEPLDIPKTVKISKSMLKAMQERRTVTGVAISTQMRRAIEADLRGELQKSSEPESDDRINFDLPDADRKKLEDLGHSMYHDDPNAFARIILRAALNAGPDVVKNLLLGKVEAVPAGLPKTPFMEKHEAVVKQLEARDEKRGRARKKNEEDDGEIAA